MFISSQANKQQVTHIYQSIFKHKTQEVNQVKASDSSKLIVSSIVGLGCSGGDGAGELT